MSIAALRRFQPNTVVEAKTPPELMQKRGREAFLQEIFGTVPAIDSIRASGPLRQPVQPTYPDIDNQDMIDIFFEAAGPFTSDPWRDWIVPAQLEYMGLPTSNRSKPYTGPKIEDLPGLKPEHKQAILALIPSHGQQVPA